MLILVPATAGKSIIWLKEVREISIVNDDHFFQVSTNPSQIFDVNSVMEDTVLSIKSIAAISEPI